MVNQSRIVTTGPIFIEASAKQDKGRVRLVQKRLKQSSPQTPPQTPKKNDRTQATPSSQIEQPSSLAPDASESLLPQGSLLADEFDVWVDEVDYNPFDSSHKTQHDFVREWLPKVNEHLKVVLSRESLSNNGVCTFCQSPDGLWVCQDCQGLPAFCRQCCRDKHTHAPYHRIRYWIGTHYKRDWLYNLGVMIQLGHHGGTCSSVHRELTSDSPSDLEGKVDVYASPSGTSDVPTGAELFTIGHTNGIHKCWVSYCCCKGSSAYDLQLLMAGLFPLSFTNCRSAFTFALLDDFRQVNLVCKVSSYFYYKKLRRLTHPWFWDAVPDRYKELRRASKQWRYLKHLKHAGVFSVDALNGLAPASLALFCAACPQEGVNIPENWRADPNQLPYVRSFVMDGNFSAVHQQQRSGAAEPWLTDGALFLARRKDFDEYIEMATEEKESPTCHSYHAVNDRLIKHKGRDITGIGSTACARHGAFCPGGTVNFQKGERQVNMDFSLCSAIKHTNIGSLRNLIIMYDINCQYNVNFGKRVQKNPGVDFPFEKTTHWGVGEFHVTAHVPSCFARHSPQFIPGAGWVDGEILESLWSLLKDVFPSTQSATLAARAEIIDMHLQESNLKKIFGIVELTIRKYLNSVTHARKASVAFEKISQFVQGRSPEYINEWEKIALEADIKRLLNPAAMDIYDTSYERKPTRSQLQREEHQEENKSGQNKGAAAWIVEGMKIQELQHAVRVLTKRTNQSQATIEEITRKRETLTTRLSRFHEEAELWYPKSASSPDFQVAGSSSDYKVDDFCDSDEDPIYIPDNSNLKKRKKPTKPRLDSPRKRRKPSPSTDASLPENQDVLLPSTLGVRVCTSLGVLPLVAKELNLRQGQANDALEAIRVAIGERSFILKKKIRPVASKKQKTRAWDAVHSARRKTRSHQWTYTKSRQAMIALGASEETLTEYRVLEEHDLRTITTIVLPNAPGQKRERLSWIWTTGAGKAEVPDNDNDATADHQAEELKIVTEMTRLNWLRARAKNLRCNEELTTAKYEMIWSVRWFLRRHQDWHALSTSVDMALRPYASAQSEMWYEIALHAETAFRAANQGYQDTFGYIPVTRSIIAEEEMSLDDD